MNTQRLALSVSMVALFGIASSAFADSSTWTPAPYRLKLTRDGDTTYDTYSAPDFYRDAGESCSRSWADSCDVWKADTGGELTDVLDIDAYVFWDNAYIVDWEVYYYDVGPQLCWGGGCEDGQWSSGVDYEWSYYIPWGYYGMYEYGDPSSARGPFDYDAATPVVRFDFLLQYAYDGTIYEWTKAIEIWTDDSP